jgi:hypothetical protein
MWIFHWQRAFIVFLSNSSQMQEMQGHSPYSNWPQAGQLRRWHSGPGRVKNFHFSTPSSLALRLTQPPIQWVPGWEMPLSLKGKWQECQADYTSPTNGMVKKCGSIHPLPHMLSHSTCTLYLLLLLTGKCWDNVLVMWWQLPSKFFPIQHSPSIHHSLPPPPTHSHIYIYIYL